MNIRVSYNMDLTHFLLTIEDHIAALSFNRPEKANALHLPAWNEMKQAFEYLDKNEEVRCVVLNGSGKHFCSGIDLELLLSIEQLSKKDCEGRTREDILKLIKTLQSSINSIEQCSKPVIAAIQGGCIGAGLDIATACDMRYCTNNAYFSIKEIDMGMVADLGTLQRLPKLISPGFVSEMAFTGQNVAAATALSVGLINFVYQDAIELKEKVREVALTISSKSPLSIRGTKENLLYARDHTVDDGLKYMQTWNAAFLLSNDLKEAFQATVKKRKPSFDN